MNIMWRKRKVVGGAVVGALALAAVALGTIGGPEDTVMPDMGGGGRGAVVLSLLAPRDFGALTPRGTADGQWCGPLTRGGTDYPAHCWELQQSTGDATDYGSPGGWHLTPSGTPRAGVATGLPVEASTVDFTSELGTWADGGATTGWTEAGASLTATSLVSVSILYRTRPMGSADTLISHRDPAGALPGWMMRTTGSGSVQALVDNGATTASVFSVSTPLSGWQCLTARLDASVTDGARFYRNGSDDTPASKNLAAAAGFLGAYDFRVHGWAQGGGAAYASYHGIARIRIDDGVAVTLAQHRALCGSWGLSLKASHRAANDTTWTQSGGARCEVASATTATCYPGGAPAARWTATGVEWAVDGQGATNRLTYSTAMDCVNWTCIGAASATPGAVAPDGSATASLIVVGAGANHFEQNVAGYTDDASPLNLAVWAKCSSGTVHPHGSDDGTRGDWDVDCTCVGGAWTKLHAAHACVTVNTPFNASATGTAGFHVDGPPGAEVVTLWAPTLTEEPTTGAVIPTAAAAVDTGTIAWIVDNASSRYGVATSTYTSVLDTVDGTCLETGSTIRLSGGAGTECVGGWYSLQVRR